MGTEAPLVTVLMSVYNGESFLAEAIASALGQTLADLELVVVDDGSTDRSPAILNGIDDGRVRIVATENRGLGSALRTGMDLARGRYVARMDADDVSAPTRLEEQVRLLESDASIGVVDSLALITDPGGRVLIAETERVAEPSCVRKWRLVWQNAVCHPAAMVRRSVLVERAINYRAESAAEDFELWAELLFYTEFARVPRQLLRQRRHAASMSATRGERHFDRVALVIGRTLERLTGQAPAPALARTLALASGQTYRRPADFDVEVTAADLAGLAGRALERFRETFRPAPAEWERIQRDTALRMLDWAWWLSQCRRPPGDGTGALVRGALGLWPGAVLTARFGRTLAGAIVGPRWLAALRRRLGGQG